MHRMLLTVCVILSLSDVALAACKDVATPGLPRSKRHGIAYRLAFNNGHQAIPHDGRGRQISQSLLDTICFDGISDLSFLTESSMTQFHADQQGRDQQESVSAKASRQERRNAIKTKLRFSETDLANLKEALED